jgi:hypothetical protein
MARLCTTLDMANLINYLYNVVRNILEISEFDANDVRRALLFRKCSL